MSEALYCQDVNCSRRFACTRFNPQTKFVDKKFKEWNNECDFFSPVGEESMTTQDRREALKAAIEQRNEEMRERFREVF